MSIPIPTNRIGGNILLGPADSLIPDILLPSQTMTESATWSGERRLMLAVLEEAVSTLFRNIRSVSKFSGREIEAVEQWLGSDEILWPFAFLNVCGACGIDPDYLRRGIEGAVLQRRQFAPMTWKRVDHSRVRHTKIS